MPRSTWQTGVQAGATAVVAGLSAGTLTWVAHSYLMSQATRARDVIGRSVAKPPEADGVYAPGSTVPERWRRSTRYDVHLMIFGDSSAAGVGCMSAEEVPGVQIAHRLAEETRKRVRLSTKAIGGATSRGLSGQVDAMLVAGPPPDAAVILVGANDVTSKNSIRASARRLGVAVERLRKHNCVVVVGTCPDLGMVAAIPQPLRTVVGTWASRLARAQAAATRAAGGHPVALADLLAPEFRASPDRMFSSDHFHPSAAGYELAAIQIAPVLATALGIGDGDPRSYPHEMSEADGAS
ncbi:SGNH/GDSL hydrolase family protein [Rhodococcus marinonascens]|uniref:SGNH/GDSL hydrolase family protein n=1 Tax=Rhodococcus marinonascens TaxID=38311 RepID=UPI00093500E3|nr:SGNH/GDSL hydrolase family protein [Rhodococcus marinonascens]